MPSLNNLKNVKHDVQVPNSMITGIKGLFQDAEEARKKAKGLFRKIILQTTVVENLDGKTFDSWIDESLIDFGDAPKENDTWRKYVSLIKWGLDNYGQMVDGEWMRLPIIDKDGNTVGKTKLEAARKTFRDSKNKETASKRADTVEENFAIDAAAQMWLTLRNPNTGKSEQRVIHRDLYSSLDALTIMDEDTRQSDAIQGALATIAQAIKTA